MAEREPLLPTWSPKSVCVVNEPEDDSLITTSIPTSTETQPILDPAPESVSLRNVLNLKLLSVMLCFFVSGMGMTAVGALIGPMEAYYSISDSTIALVFPAATTGYLCTMPVLQPAVARYGWRVCALVSSVGFILASTIYATAPPFALIPLCHFILGLSYGFSDMGFNAWASKLPYINIVEGLIHGSFSLGCVIGPVAVATVIKLGYEWYILYRGKVILDILNIVALNVAFHHETAISYSKNLPQSSQSRVRTAHPLRERAVWISGIFLFFYISAEASLTNWAIEFMKRERHFGLTIASLTSSTFWGGMAIGRFGLGFVTEYFGIAKAVAIYIAFAACLQLALGFVTNVSGSLVLLGMIGFFLGPVFASMVVLLSAKVSPQIYISAVAVVLGIGQAGGAFAPVCVAFLAEKVGMSHFPEVVFGLLTVVLVVWLIFLRIR